MKIAVFDLEIKKPIAQCSRGWDSYDEMGISIMVLADYVTHRYRVFDEHNIKEGLSILCNYDLVVGFNSVNFDWRVLQATYKDLNRVSKDYDILREIWISLGVNPDVFDPQTHGGYKLDDVAFDTIHLRKSGDGADAPLLYQEGRHGELVDYCLNDVRVTKELFDFIRRYRYVVREGRRILMPDFRDKVSKITS